MLGAPSRRWPDVLADAGPWGPELSDPLEVRESGPARLVIDLRNGGRLSSLCIDGLELLVQPHGAEGMRWGCFPMAPWAGRVRDGRFVHRGREYRLPLGLQFIGAPGGDEMLMAVGAAYEDAAGWDMTPPGFG